MEKPVVNKKKILEDGSVLIGWKEYKEELKFLVKRSESADGYFETLAKVSSQDGEYLDNTVELNKSYWYKVIAFKVVNKEKKYNRSLIFKIYTYIKREIEITSVETDNEGLSKISWNKLDKVDGYALFKRNEHGMKPVKMQTFDVDTNECEDQNILGTVNHYIIKAFALVDESVIYIAESEPCTASSIAKTEILQCKKHLLGGVSLKLRIVSGASGYIIERKDADEAEFKEIARTNSNVEFEVTDKPKKAKKCTYRAKAYKIVGEEILISEVSETKKVK
ncbi:MAG: hypothetical protein R3Y27_01500 [Clostridia bacterium]